MSSKVLFILKRRNDFNPIKHSPLGLSTGLFNSASFMRDMLQQGNVASEIEVAIDNNCIDRLVSNHRPKYVIIEALWVVPTKFTVLAQLHPKVKWIVRLHSEMPFMAGEGMAMDWLGDYIEFPNILIGVNAPRMLNEIRMYLKLKTGLDNSEIEKRVVYLPNYYPKEYKTKQHVMENKEHVDIACFGAVRPLKNHLLQAFASLKFAERIGKKLKFHINGGRIEMKGDAHMNNLRGLFQQLTDTGHELVVHEWAPREEFLVTCSEMDIGLQCNFSETFNIVSADLVSQGVPIVGSKEIPWSVTRFNADPTSSDDIADKIERAYNTPKINVSQHQKNLDKYTNNTAKVWLDFFGGE